jgi:hypothetical protein
VLQALEKTAKQALLDPSVRARSVKFQQWFALAQAGSISVASQGIVVAGQLSSDLRVLNNTVQNVLQGIHVGVSHEVPANSPNIPDVAGTVRIDANTINVGAPQDALKRERHAIFVGNCDSISIEDNRVRVTRPPGSELISVSALMANGFIGRKVLVRHNHVTGFSVGMEFKPRFPFPQKGQVAWLAADNLFESTAADFRFPVTPKGKPSIGVPPLAVSGNILIP